MKYYVNKNPQQNGDHEVHIEICTRIPDPENRLYLGDYSSCGPAVAAAQIPYPTANGCAFCSAACNTGRAVRTQKYA